MTRTKSPPPIVLGCMARDMLTGFEGMVVATCQYINGCDRVGIQPPTIKGTGILPHQEWFDITRVVWTGKGVSVDRVETGGPQRDPPSMRGIAGMALLTISALSLASCFDNPRTPADYALIRQHAAFERAGIGAVSGGTDDSNDWFVAGPR